MSYRDIKLIGDDIWHLRIHLTWACSKTYIKIKRHELNQKYKNLTTITKQFPNYYYIIHRYNIKCY